jgi:DNA-binding NtrC family response regulator
MSENPGNAFRWQSFFQSAAQPIFLLNRRCRILFVNQAWEKCVGLKLAEVRGRACRRRSRTAALEKEDAILSALSPSADALEGRSCQARRRAPNGADWWEIQFLPLTGADGLVGILGVMRVLAAPTDAPFTLPEKLMALRDRQATRYRLDDLDASTPALARLHEQAKLASATRLPITLLGEPGSGKEWLARAIHAQSDQRGSFFACLDAQRLSADGLGEVLFGPASQRLVFGTIYLREPAQLPREWQGRLAEAVTLRESLAFPRLIVGFDGDPRREMQEGRMSEEFYCAISPVTITIPPLRERLPELPRFIDRFLQRIREWRPHTVQDMSAEAMDVLRSYAWPENLRELLGVLQDACARAKSDRIEAADLPFYLKEGKLPAERRLPLDALLEQVERRLIALALKLTQNNQTRAAELLEIWRPRLQRRMEKFGYSKDESQGPT